MSEWNLVQLEIKGTVGPWQRYHSDIFIFPALHTNPLSCCICSVHSDGGHWPSRHTDNAHIKHFLTFLTPLYSAPLRGVCKPESKAHRTPPVCLYSEHRSPLKINLNDSMIFKLLLRVSFCLSLCLTCKAPCLKGVIHIKCIFIGVYYDQYIISIDTCTSRDVKDIFSFQELSGCECQLSRFIMSLVYGIRIISQTDTAPDTVTLQQHHVCCEGWKKNLLIIVSFILYLDLTAVCVHICGERSKSNMTDERREPASPLFLFPLFLWWAASQLPYLLFLLLFLFFISSSWVSFLSSIHSWCTTIWKQPPWDSH